jgi:hypothetical protein
LNTRQFEEATQTEVAERVARGDEIIYRILSTAQKDDDALTRKQFGREIGRFSGRPASGRGHGAGDAGCPHGRSAGLCRAAL